MAQKERGLRYNEGKLRYDLVHPLALEGLVRVLTRGAAKYAPRNWEKGMPWSEVLASADRHFAAIKKGEDYDPETGELHVDHLQCNIHFLSAYYRIFPQGDDRPAPYLRSYRIGLDIDDVLADCVGGMKLAFPELNTPEYWNDPAFGKCFDQVKEDNEFWLSLPPKIPPKTLPFEPAAYITSRSVPVHITQEWLDKWGFPSARVFSVGYEMSKVEAATRAELDFFVDDRFENFRDLNNAGICTYLFTAPHNKRYDVGHKRIDNLDQLPFLTPCKA